ncbi:MAG: LysM peptidoglycan-binding domain-containing protein [Actinobacteria bacterium]|uniref:Unannotated protein n=1 Tax=freshwater metagenome TaxID=449393 RepID=A0A6J5ZJ76_9ZZZZ|nr:LysM peptidoglycan-binding domain-containing protein [Actinomycetota bacterium]
MTTASPSLERGTATYQPIRLTQRGRTVVALLAMIAGVLTFLAIGALTAQAQSVTQMTTVVVHSGESLWDIAVAISPESDPRSTIYDIQQINGLTTSEVLEGQELIVPVS